nr:hypothetical protein [Saprospiraceae bacterium]
VLIAIVIGYLNLFMLKFVILKIGNLYGSSKSVEAVQHYLNFMDFYVASLTLSGLFFIIYSINKAKKDDFFSASFLLPVSTKEKFLSELFLLCILLPATHLSFFLSTYYIIKTLYYSNYFELGMSWSNIIFYCKSYWAAICLILPFITIFKYSNINRVVLGILGGISALILFKLLGIFKFEIPSSLLHKTMTSRTLPNLFLLSLMGISSLFLLYHSIKEKQIK